MPREGLPLLPALPPRAAARAHLLRAPLPRVGPALPAAPLGVAMRETTCSTCQASIVWLKTSLGKPMPVDEEPTVSLDGEAHEMPAPA